MMISDLRLLSKRRSWIWTMEQAAIPFHSS